MGDDTGEYNMEHYIGEYNRVIKGDTRGYQEFRL